MKKQDEKQASKKYIFLAVITVMTTILFLSLTWASALNFPPYREDFEHHATTRGTQASIQSTDPSLSTNNPQWWAKSYVVEMVIANKPDPSTAGAVGAGYTKYIDNNGATHYQSVRYKYDRAAAVQSYGFDTAPSIGSSSTYYAARDNPSPTCSTGVYRWHAVSYTFDEEICISSMDWAHTRVSVTFSSTSNTIPGHFATTKYKNTTNTWQNWSGLTDTYCHNTSGFWEKTTDNGNTWDFGPPGTQTSSCSSGSFDTVNLPG